MVTYLGYLVSPEPTPSISGLHFYYLYSGNACSSDFREAFESIAHSARLLVCQADPCWYYLEDTQTVQMLTGHLGEYDANEQPEMNMLLAR